MKRETITEEAYESLFHEEFDEFLVSPVHRNAAEALEIEPKDSFLDIGCGQGELVYLAKKKGCLSLCGIDFLEKAFDIAKQKVPSAKFFTGNAIDIPFPDSSFTKIAGLGVIGYLSPADIPKCFSEISRILKSGGYFLICTAQPLNIIGTLVLKIKTKGKYRATSHRYHLSLLSHAARACGLETSKTWLSMDAEKKGGWKRIIYFLVFPFFAQRWILFKRI